MIYRYHINYYQEMWEYLYMYMTIILIDSCDIIFMIIIDHMQWNWFFSVNDENLSE